MKLVAETLWEYLSEEHAHCHSRAVTLLYQLHQLSPDPWTCEDVICSALLSPDKVLHILCIIDLLDLLGIFVLKIASQFVLTLGFPF